MTGIRQTVTSHIECRIMTQFIKVVTILVSAAIANMRERIMLA